jgi:hypothetical protein
MIDAFARSEGIPMTTVHCKALFGEGSLTNLHASLGYLII